MHDNPTQVRRDGRLPDALWGRIEPLLPPRQPHPLGCHRPRVDDRQAMEALCFVLRTGCQGQARRETGLCSRRCAPRRLHAWAEAGGVGTLGPMGLAAYDALQGMDWAWLAMDSAMTTAPLGGKGGQAPLP